MKTRKTVREVVMKCVPCRRYSSNSPMSEPVSLPADRVKDANAFDITGIDLAGPLFLLEMEKRIKYRRKLIHDFRLRFRKEYLGQLRQKRPGKPGHDFKVGDVVMIEETIKNSCIGL
ncbi:hypothetical protein TNCV_4910391 [Trichonephila clavipes]|nr:hypothetical protein TNCV_4910391 [Trichonephila clavipes]